jgi:hypothetical protein
MSFCSIRLGTFRQLVKKSVIASSDFSETQHIIVNTTNSGGAKKRSRNTRGDILQKMRLSTNEKGPHLLNA